MARLLLVHAHPDDETLTTGVTAAHYLARGHEVEVLTCTLGEEGEVIPPELRHLEATGDEQLGVFRRGELDEAMRRLGARHSLLGADTDAQGMPRWRDSGMAGTPSAHHPRAFASADVQVAAEVLLAHLRATSPDVVVTYDVDGGYLHPDHVQTRRVVQAALAQAVDDELPCAAYEIVVPQSWARQDREWLAAHVPADGGLHVPTLDEPYPPSVVADELVTHVVVDPGAVPRQRDALRAHRTQVTVDDDYYALSNLVAARLPGREAFVRWDPRTGTRMSRGATAWAHGLLGEA